MEQAESQLTNKVAPDRIHHKAFYESPVGTLVIECDCSAIISIHFFDDPIRAEQSDDTQQCDLLKECTTQLDNYFKGVSESFNLPLSPIGTDFQKQVWQELTQISFGKTISYLELSKSFGDPKLTRAVGGANGKNPIAIIIPCHRVIGNDGSLTGYAGGLHRKRWLLNFEQHAFQSQLF